MNEITSCVRNVALASSYKIFRRSENLVFCIINKFNLDSARLYK